MTKKSGLLRNRTVRHCLGVAALLLLAGSHFASATNSDDDTAPLATKNGSDDPVTLHSEHILQAQLTAALEDKSPTDRLGPRIFMNERGLIRIYLFTEMEGLNNQRVFFDWYLEDERQARVTVRPHLERMRASTSKFIDRNMLGSWQVRVLLSDDTVLTSAEFEVLAHTDKPADAEPGEFESGEAESESESDQEDANEDQETTAESDAVLPLQE